MSASRLTKIGVALLIVTGALNLLCGNVLLGSSNLLLATMLVD